MENQYQKIVNVSFLVLSALVYFLFFMTMMKLSNAYDLESRIRSVEYVIRGLSIVIAVGVFFGLYRNATANAFMNEVSIELLSKVTWPSGKDTFSATAVVIVTVVLAGIVLAVFDWVFTFGLHSLWSTTQRWFQ